jgi:hypothetical protein
MLEIDEEYNKYSTWWWKLLKTNFTRVFSKWLWVTLK